MKQIRYGVFETNSSSTHSLVICNDDDYKRWKSGELVFDSNKDTFVLVQDLSQAQMKEAEELYNSVKTSYMKNWNDLDADSQISYARTHLDLDSNDGYSFNEYQNKLDEYEESFEETFKTPHGDIVHVLGYYGYDG